MLNSRDRRLLQTILDGRSDANVRFSELRRLLRNLGFEERIRGSHHLFVSVKMEAMINIQPKNSMVKPYQVRQFRAFVIRHGILADDS